MQMYIVLKNNMQIIDCTWVTLSNLLWHYIFAQPVLSENSNQPTGLLKGEDTKKKLRPAGVRQSTGIALRRGPSHAGREKHRAPAPPIHNATIAHVILIIETWITQLQEPRYLHTEYLPLN